MKYKYNISRDTLDTEYNDEPPWRHYALEAYGNDAKEIYCNALVTEVDEDGGDINTYGLLEASKEVFAEVANIIHAAVNKPPLN